MAIYEVVTEANCSKGENEALQENINLHVSFTYIARLLHTVQDVYTS